MATDTLIDTQAQQLKQQHLIDSVSALEAASASIAAGIDEQLVTGDQVYNLLWTIIQRIKEKAM